MSILGFTDPLFTRLVGHLPEDERLSSMHIVDERGRVHSGGDALIILFSIHPKTRWRARAARLLPPVRTRIRNEYRKIADRRGELSEEVDDVEPVRVPPAWTRLPGDTRTDPGSVSD